MFSRTAHIHDAAVLLNIRKCSEYSDQVQNFNTY